jgi:hypothetical protein
VTRALAINAFAAASTSLSVVGCPSERWRNGSLASTTSGAIGVVAL